MTVHVMHTLLCEQVWLKFLNSNYVFNTCPNQHLKPYKLTLVLEENTMIYQQSGASFTFIAYSKAKLQKKEKGHFLACAQIYA